MQIYSPLRCEIAQLEIGMGFGIADGNITGIGIGFGIIAKLTGIGFGIKKSTGIGFGIVEGGFTPGLLQGHYVH